MPKIIGANKTMFLLAVPVAVLLLAAVLVAKTSAQEHNNGASADGSGGVAYNGPAGIRVSGQGSASGTPDIAIISLGVESVEDTAALARANAAAAMDKIMEVLAVANIKAPDIQTTYFNISPRYQGVEVTRCITEKPQLGESCWEEWKQMLVGYSVTNNVSVKIRTPGTAGTIIDEVTAASGDLVSINGISFGIEDPQKLQNAALADAVADMKQKAKLLANRSGVELGRLVYLSEESYYTPNQMYWRAEPAAAYGSSYAGMPTPTAIAIGELEFTASVQGSYLIAGAKSSP